MAFLYVGLIDPLPPLLYFPVPSQLCRIGYHTPTPGILVSALPQAPL